MVSGKCFFKSKVIKNCYRKHNKIFNTKIFRIPSIIDKFKSFGYLTQRLDCIFISKSDHIVSINKNNSCTFFILNQLGYLHDMKNNCLSIQINGSIKVNHCQKEYNLQQIWIRQHGKLFHRQSGKCLENHIKVKSSLRLADCKKENIYQLWRFSIKS